MRSTVCFVKIACKPLHRPKHFQNLQLRCFSVMQHNAGVEEAGVAVIGGGVSGLSCALQLAAKGLRPTVFDMGTRAAGGRCSSRHEEQQSFDHGCQVITEPSKKAFKHQFEAWKNAGVVQQWSGRFGRLDSTSHKFQPWPVPAGNLASSPKLQSATPHPDGFLAGLQPGPLYTGAPSMQSLCAHMATQLERSAQGTVKLSHKVEGAAWDVEQRAWRLTGSLRGRAAAAAAEGSSAGLDLGWFKGLVVADSLVCIPDSAGYAKLQGASAEVVGAVQRAASIESDPVFSLMVAFDESLPGISFDAAVIGGGAFQWLACNSSKPGRPNKGPQCWVAVTTPSYARQVMEQFPLHIQGRYNPQTSGYLESVAPVLYSELEQLMAHHLPGDAEKLPQPAFLRAQRWGRGFNRKPLGVPCLSAPSQSFAVCGDFCTGPSVEDAWMSGWAAAEELAAALQT